MFHKEKNTVALYEGGNCGIVGVESYLFMCISVEKNPER